MVLKDLGRAALAYLLTSPKAVRFLTGIVALLGIWLLVSLVFAFPVFFTALFMFCVFGFVVYILGNVIWSFIES